MSLFIFFFNDTATTEIYTLSLHDALPIWPHRSRTRSPRARHTCRRWGIPGAEGGGCGSAGTRSGAASRSCAWRRSEEHTSELQSLAYLVCRLLLEKKKKKYKKSIQVGKEL